jgi:hypothetical protein
MSDKMREGGPVYPFEYHNQTSSHQPKFFREGTLSPGASEQFAGLTLRQWYAGLAMQSMVVSPTFHDEPARTLAAMAFNMADAMIAEGEK